LKSEIQLTSIFDFTADPNFSKCLYVQQNLVSQRQTRRYILYLFFQSRLNSNVPARLQT